MSWYSYDRFPRYVSVAERKRKAAKVAEKLKKKGQIMRPVVLVGRTIANTFWGKAWCDNLESYSDYDNRLPRGRTYVRNGSVIDLHVAAGEINAMVSGSSIYKVKITISAIVASKWEALVKECAGKINSLIELLQGKFSKGIMEIIARPEKGLFPHPKEIKLDCSCPDYADMCKHVAAVLYGIGARLDEKPEELFLLRKADHGELIAQAGKSTLAEPMTTKRHKPFADNDLSALFGIDIDRKEQTIVKQGGLPKEKLPLPKGKRKLIKRHPAKSISPSITKKIRAVKIRKPLKKRGKLAISKTKNKNDKIKIKKLPKLTSKKTRVTAQIKRA